MKTNTQAPAGVHDDAVPATRLRYFHGGPPGLKYGEYILPSSATGAPSTADYGAESVCRRDRVYLVSDLQAAVSFASLHPSGKGQVYEVRPEGVVGPDPDCNEPGLSWEAERAFVLRVVALRSTPASTLTYEAGVQFGLEMAAQTCPHCAEDIRKAKDAVAGRN